MQEELQQEEVSFRHQVTCLHPSYWAPQAAEEGSLDSQSWAGVIDVLPFSDFSSWEEGSGQLGKCFFFFLSFMLSLPQMNLGVLLLPQIKGRILEREIAEQSREAAYLRHKYGISCTVFKGVFEVLGLSH